MLGRYIDLGNPVAAHPNNVGLRAWFLGIPGLTGARLRDAAGSGYDATRSGIPTFKPDPAGFYGVSVSVGSGALDVIGYPYTPGTGAFGAGCWIRFGGQGGTPIFAGTTEGGNSWWLGVSGGLLTLGVNGSQITGGTIAVGPWYYVQATRAASGAAAIYINGVQTATGTLSASVTKTGLGLGESGPGGSYVWTGDVSGFRYHIGTTPDPAVEYLQATRGYPDLLRRYSLRAYPLMVAGGGPAAVRARRSVAARVGSRGVL